MSFEVRESSPGWSSEESYWIEGRCDTVLRTRSPRCGHRAGTNEPAHFRLRMASPHRCCFGLRGAFISSSSASLPSRAFLSFFHDWLSIRRMKLTRKGWVSKYGIPCGFLDRIRYPRCVITSGKTAPNVLVRTCFQFPDLSYPQRDSVHRKA